MTYPTQTSRRRYHLAIAATLRVALIAGCGSAVPDSTAPAIQPEDPPPGATLAVVRLALQWQPQSQFAGYYLARDKGLYRAAAVIFRSRVHQLSEVACTTY